ncbi:glycosyltransferase family 2 protein [Candidatus Saccharibacteria bacterium]|nr:glycosyltransferase family 2 protein [Candidatus Saccharibacteria bacterium]
MLNFLEIRKFERLSSQQKKEQFGSIFIINLVIVFVTIALNYIYLLPIEVLFVVPVLFALRQAEELIRTIQAKNKFGFDAVASPLINESKPAVSLLIPARNEDINLTKCLEQSINSNYEKLEIIVLDDCSSDKTPEIIKDFAHDGVRFISGTEPRTDWSGKNNALQRLSEEASGKWLVYCDVDVDLQVDSITKLIDYAEQEKIDMLSVWPQRYSVDVIATLLEPSIGKTQLQKSRSDNPVSGRLWLIKAESLRSIGGFDSVKNHILPEQTLANIFSERNGYRYIVSNVELGITVRKRPSSHVHNLIRTLYPQHGLLSLNAVVFSLWRLTLPVFLGYSVYIIITQNQAIYLTAFVIGAICLFMREFVATTILTPSVWYLAPFSYFISYFIEPVLLVISMYRYEFSEVSWRDRLVCYPTLQTIPVLPPSQEQA